MYNTIHCLYCIIPCHTMLVYYGVVHHDMEHHPSVMHHALVLCTPAACRDGVVLQPPPITPYHILVHRTILWLYLHAGHTEFQNRTCLGSILSMEYGCIDIDLYVLLKIYRLNWFLNNVRIPINLQLQMTKLERTKTCLHFETLRNSGSLVSVSPPTECNQMSSLKSKWLSCTLWWS